MSVSRIGNAWLYLRFIVDVILATQPSQIHIKLSSTQMDIESIHPSDLTFKSIDYLITQGLLWHL